MHTTHTSISQSRSGGHVSHEENARNMQLEIDHLQKKLRHERRRTPSIFASSFGGEGDGSYKPKSRTALVSLSRMMRTTIMSPEIGTRFAKARETMQ